MTTEAQNQDGGKDGGKGKLDILYGVEDTPPWYLCIILGFQVTIQKNVQCKNKRNIGILCKSVPQYFWKDEC